MMVELYDALGRSPDKPLATFRSGLSSGQLHADVGITATASGSNGPLPRRPIIWSPVRRGFGAVSDLSKWMHTIVNNLANQIVEKSVLLTRSNGFLTA